MRFSLVFILIVVLGFFALGQTPSTSSSGISFSDIYCSQLKINWTVGDGNFRIVVASEGAALTTLPKENDYFLADYRYGYGNEVVVGSNAYVVYNGNGNNTVVDFLKSNTTYYFSIFEFNGGGSAFNYLTTGYPESSVTTKQLDASFTIDDPYQCEHNNLTTFTSSVVENSGVPLTYSWDFDDGNTSSVHNPTHSYSSYGIYSVKLKVSSTNCESEVIHRDTVASNPDVSFQLTDMIAGNTLEQCFLRPDGSLHKFRFESTTTGGSLGTPFDNYKHYYYFGDGTRDFDLGLDTKKTYDKAGSYDIKLVVKSTQNNVEYCVDSTSVTVSVKPKPIDSSLLVLDSIKCIGHNLFEFAHNTSDAGAIHTWDFGDGNSSMGSSVSHSYTAIGRYKITLNVQDAIGCFDAYSDSVVVIPSPDNDFTGLKDRYCEGAMPVQLTANIPDGVWIGADVDANGLFTPSMQGPSTVRYALNDNNCVDTAIKITEIYPIPKFSLGQDTSICSGATFIKKIDKNGANISWSSGESDSFANVSSGGILWARKSIGGCSHRDSILVKEINMPQVNLGEDSLLCGDGVRVVDVLAEEATFEWSDGYAGGGKRNITKSGDYELTVTNKCGTATDNVSLTFLPYACAIFVPNAFSPNGDGLNDVFRANGTIDLKSMQIYDKWGALLYESLEAPFAWDGYYESDLLKEGVYFFVIRYTQPSDGKDVPHQISGGLRLVR